VCRAAEWIMELGSFGFLEMFHTISPALGSLSQDESSVAHPNLPVCPVVWLGPRGQVVGESNVTGSAGTSAAGARRGRGTRCGDQHNSSSAVPLQQPVYTVETRAQSSSELTMRPQTTPVRPAPTHSAVRYTQRGAGSKEPLAVLPKGLSQSGQYILGSSITRDYRKGKIDSGLQGCKTLFFFRVDARVRAGGACGVATRPASQLLPLSRWLAPPHFSTGKPPFPCQKASADWARQTSAPMDRVFPASNRLRNALFRG